MSFPVSLHTTTDSSRGWHFRLNYVEINLRRIWKWRHIERHYSWRINGQNQDFASHPRRVAKLFCVSTADYRYEAINYGASGSGQYYDWGLFSFQTNRPTVGEARQSGSSDVAAEFALPVQVSFAECKIICILQWLASWIFPTGAASNSLLL